MGERQTEDLYVEGSNPSRGISMKFPLSLADFFTILNGLFGMLAIFMIFSGEQGYAIRLILLAVLADGMDGIVARKIGSSGGYLDEFSDVISFCVVPCLMIYTISDIHIVARFMACSIFLIFGMIHLVRYHFGKKDYFIGIPTPSATLVIVMMMCLSIDPWIIVASAILLSFLMISNLEYPRIKGVFSIIAALLIFLVLIFGGSYGSFAPLSLLAGVIFYIILGPFYQKLSKQAVHFR